MRHAHHDLNECASAEVSSARYTFNISCAVLGFRKNRVETFPIEAGQFVFLCKFFEKVLANSETVDERILFRQTLQMSEYLLQKRYLLSNFTLSLLDLLIIRIHGI